MSIEITDDWVNDFGREIYGDQWELTHHDMPSWQANNIRRALTAAAPIIRADERRRVIAEIQASDLGAPLQLNPDGTARFLTGPELRERICAFIAERSGK